MQNVSWEFIAGIAAIISTICVAFSNDPLPIHTHRHLLWGRWIGAAFWLSFLVGILGSVIVFDEFASVYKKVQKISMMTNVESLQIAIKAVLIIYLFVSARVLVEIKKVGLPRKDQN